MATSYRAPSSQVVAEVAPLADKAGSVLVDEVIATGVAASIAERTDMPVKYDLQNELVSLDIRQQLAQQSEVQIVKPQIVEIDTGVRTIQKYKVKPGDTIEKIAAQFDINAQTIRWANDIETGGAARVGTTLKIPPTDSVLYTVKPTDTLQSIAKRYNADEQRIIAFNNLEVSGIKKGSTLVIPGGTLPRSERPGYEAPQQRRVFYTNYAYSSGYGRINIQVIGYGSPRYPGNGGGYGQCTQYAYDRRYELGRALPGGALGNAREWDNTLGSRGYTVNRTPAAGAVIQRDSGYYGHVGVVEEVMPNGDIIITEMNNVGNNIVNRALIKAADTGSWKYIH